MASHPAPAARTCAAYGRLDADRVPRSFDLHPELAERLAVLGALHNERPKRFGFGLHG
jgi:hypothetical protein